MRMIFETVVAAGTICSRTWLLVETQDAGTDAFRLQTAGQLDPTGLRRVSDASLLSTPMLWTGLRSAPTARLCLRRPFSSTPRSQLSFTRPQRLPLTRGAPENPPTDAGLLSFRDQVARSTEPKPFAEQVGRPGIAQQILVRLRHRAYVDQDADIVLPSVRTVWVVCRFYACSHRDQQGHE
jgi:hypothetical protein